MGIAEDGGVISLYSAKYSKTGVPLPWMSRTENLFARFSGLLYVTTSFSISTLCSSRLSPDHKEVFHPPVPQQYHVRELGCHEMLGRWDDGTVDGRTLGCESPSIFVV